MASTFSAAVPDLSASGLIDSFSHVLYEHLSDLRRLRTTGADLPGRADDHWHVDRLRCLGCSGILRARDQGQGPRSRSGRYRLGRAGPEPSFRVWFTNARMVSRRRMLTLLRTAVAIL